MRIERIERGTGDGDGALRGTGDGDGAESSAPRLCSCVGLCGVLRLFVFLFSSFSPLLSSSFVLSRRSDERRTTPRPHSATPQRRTPFLITSSIIIQHWGMPGRRGTKRGDICMVCTVSPPSSSLSIPHPPRCTMLLFGERETLCIQSRGLLATTGYTQATHGRRFGRLWWS